MYVWNRVCAFRSSRSMCCANEERSPSYYCEMFLNCCVCKVHDEWMVSPSHCSLQGHGPPSYCTRVNNVLAVCNKYHWSVLWAVEWQGQMHVAFVLFTECAYTISCCFLHCCKNLCFGLAPCTIYDARSFAKCFIPFISGPGDIHLFIYRLC